MPEWHPEAGPTWSNAQVTSSSNTTCLHRRVYNMPTLSCTTNLPCPHSDWSPQIHSTLQMVYHAHLLWQGEPHALRACLLNPGCAVHSMREPRCLPICRLAEALSQPSRRTCLTSTHSAHACVLYNRRGQASIIARASLPSVQVVRDRGGGGVLTGLHQLPARKHPHDCVDSGLHRARRSYRYRYHGP